MVPSRKTFLETTVAIASSFLSQTNSATAFSIHNNVNLQNSNPRALVAETTMNDDATQLQQPQVAYRSLSLLLGESFGDTTVPVACWYPVANNITNEQQQQDESNLKLDLVTSYPHCISIRRIGQLLAGWNFLPPFFARQFALQPTRPIVDGHALPLPSSAPVVMLAHGYLGSRFDLCHLGEALAAAGFVCVSPEYPESLAASYDRVGGVDRAVITTALLRALPFVWNLQPTAYGIVGHSLGCGTALRTGDDTWTRVCIAGNPSVQVPGNILWVSSMNDGVVRLRARGLTNVMVPNCVQLEEQDLSRQLSFRTTTAATSNTDYNPPSPPPPVVLPNRAALVFDRPDAPNHISFLAEGVNDAMMDFLSPLLPVAQALDIPVLDFDRYQKSRDSVATATIVTPLVVAYLEQHMMTNKK